MAHDVTCTCLDTVAVNVTCFVTVLHSLPVKSLAAEGSLQPRKSQKYAMVKSGMHRVV